MDIYLAMTHALGLSAYSYVLRRMTILSKVLANLLIQHDSCGSHLKLSGENVDAKLQKKNFKVARDMLSHVWGELVLDGKSVTVEYAEN